MSQRCGSAMLHFWVFAALGINVSCEAQSKPDHKRPRSTVQHPSTGDAPARAKLGALLKRDESQEHDEPPEVAVGKPARAKQPFILDELVDVAPAGPAAAAAEGVVLIAKSDNVRLAALGSASNTPRPVPTPVTPVDGDPKDFVARARGPAVVRHSAYWISGSRLVRQAITGGPLEVLANDARAYTQVAGLPQVDPSTPNAVAYVGVRPNGQSNLVARFWIEGGAAQDLSPEGTTANSVALVRRQNDWLALFLEARTGMSPLHARAIAFTPQGATLGADFIAWVAGSAQPMTIVRAISDEQQTWAFLPIERDISRFGLARIAVADMAKTEPVVAWRDYPNGMDPAPIATALVCGRPMVLYSRPSSAAPHAPQELHLAAVLSTGLGPSTLVGSSRGYSDVSLAAIAGGALVVFVADHRTWARRIRCSH